jgi:hypothetical protein
MNQIRALKSLFRQLLFAKTYSRRQFAAVSTVLVVLLAAVLLNMKHSDDEYIRRWRAEHSVVSR